MVGMRVCVASRSDGIWINAEAQNNQALAFDPGTAATISRAKNIFQTIHLLVRNLVFVTWSLYNGSFASLQNARIHTSWYIYNNIIRCGCIHNDFVHFANSEIFTCRKPVRKNHTREEIKLNSNLLCSTNIFSIVVHEHCTVCKLKLKRFAF